MKTTVTKLKILAVVIGIPWLVLTGCALNDNAATASMHNSDNNALVRSKDIDAGLEKARINSATQANNAASREAIAGIRANAQIERSAERTQQTLLTQNASSERLLLQSQHLLAVRAEGTQRFNTFLIVVVILAVLGGGMFLFIYLRNNPQPIAYQMLPQQPQYAALPQQRPALPQSAGAAIQQAPAVPYSTFVNDPRFNQAGWSVTSPDTGQRVVDGVVIAECKLLEG